jgi:hypothetical protein
VDSNEPALRAQYGLASQAPLAGTPWSIRHARGSGRQPALEIYEAGDLIAVMVATAVAPQLLGGARRVSQVGQTLSLAWGRQPADGLAMTVSFTASRLRRITSPREAPEAIRPEVTDLGGWCWLAVAAARFDAVVVTHRGARERLRLRAGGGR